MEKKNIFIVGSKGIPANYGGFESFVEGLTKNKKSEDIQYYVTCLADVNSEFEYNNAKCFNIKTPKLGSAKVIFHDIKALKFCIKYIKNNGIKNALIYILGCKIGPFIGKYKKKLNKMNIPLLLNPDGQEWKRDKWVKPIKTYLKLSEKLMIKNCDLAICDSKNIENIINEEYSKFNPKTTFIAYGSNIKKSSISNDAASLLSWYKEKEVNPNEYYLVVGRFVPENNYETMIKEFMKSFTKKDLIIITNVKQNKFYERLKITTNFTQDKRIKFVGTVYDQELLKKLRENAYGYIHGHSVGGTNPSLIEALASTKLNLLLDVCFNREVGDNSALYWSKESNNLAYLINSSDTLSSDEIIKFGELATKRIVDEYSWDIIVEKYEKVFLGEI